VLLYLLAMTSSAYINPSPRLPQNVARRAREIAAQLNDARRTRDIASLYRQRTECTATPLLSLPRLAERLGIGELWAKDERNRWSLGSFKALGGVYATLTLAAESLSRRCRRSIPIADVLRGDAPSANHMTFSTATSGNHGRAVAFGAELAGANAVIFVHDTVSEERVAAIAAHGAQIVPVAGDYETAVSLCTEQSRANDWVLVSDFAEAGYENIPLRVMQGYSVLVAEALDAMKQPPTHVFVQAGVGGLAAAVVAYITANCDPAPLCVVIEADVTACLAQSARQSRLVTAESGGRTVLGRLECRKPSSVAWPVLAQQAAAFVAIDDDTAIAAARALVNEGLKTTPSGAAGLAGIQHALSDRDLRTALRLDHDSRVLIVITEQTASNEEEP
jgi:diaminopropionate ammonia-lyase